MPTTAAARECQGHDLRPQVLGLTQKFEVNGLAQANSTLDKLVVVRFVRCPVQPDEREIPCQS